MAKDELKLSGWALILGSSSGFGEATSLELARRGMDIFGVHLDRRSTLPNVERIVGEIRGMGRQAEFFNVNAADEEKRKQVCADIASRGVKVRLLMHSLAFGTLRPFIHPEPKEGLTKQQMDMTLDVMAHSLVYWTQDLVANNLFEEGGRIYAMTSTGSGRVWATYGAVSAAKAALESHIRQLALELAPKKISANAIMAGVTDTPALRKIPGNDKMMEVARERNPYKRLTTPQDVASAIAALSFGPAGWITGNTICVDGGEEISG